MRGAAESLDLEIPHDPETSLDAVREAAEIWGAEWRRLGRAGSLELPVSAGLRYGLVSAELTCQESANGSTLKLDLEEAAYRINMPALSVIVVGAAGAGAMILAPLVPKLLTLVPVGLIVMVCAWFLVLSRLQHRGPREFLELVREVAAHPEPRDAEDLENVAST